MVDLEITRSRPLYRRTRSVAEKEGEVEGEGGRGEEGGVVGRGERKEGGGGMRGDEGGARLRVSVRVKGGSVNRVNGYSSARQSRTYQ